MKIAIIEDFKVDSSNLADLIGDYFLHENTSFEIQSFISAEDFFVSWPLDLDIIFIDIQLDRMNGIEAALKIRETNERVVIIFVTNNPQYSLAGYSVEALDYLLKPVSRDFLQNILTKAIRRLGSSTRKYLTIYNKDGYFVVNPMDVNYVEFQNRKIIIHTNSGPITYLRTLQYMEEQLPKTFFRCHNAFLINLNAVESVQGQNVIVAGKMIPISKHRRKEFIRALTACIGEKL